MNEFVLLPLSVPGTPQSLRSITHYLYLRAHEPKIASPDSARSLYVSNVPVDGTVSHFRRLFASDILGAVRVERVDFEDSKFVKRGIPNAYRTKKRKRNVDGDAALELPVTWTRQVGKSGSIAVVVFADKPSMDVALKMVKRHTRRRQTVDWPAETADEACPPLGSARYASHHRLRFPPRHTLQTCVDAYMTAFGDMEQTRLRNAARLRQQPDEEGFVTVTKGARVAPRKDVIIGDEAQERLEKKNRKELEQRNGLADFYRFQVRERRKAQADDLISKFDAEKRVAGSLGKISGRTFRPQ